MENETELYIKRKIQIEMLRKPTLWYRHKVDIGIQI